MKSTAVITIAIIISAVLLAVELSPAMNMEQFREGGYIHLEKVEVKFDGPDANVDIQYQLSPFARVYMFLFGSRYLESKIEEIFFDFEESTVQRIEGTQATIRINNISRQSDGWFLHNSQKLGLQTDTLTLVDPDGNRTDYDRISVIPDTFYPRR